MMTINELFREVLRDPIFIDKYGFTPEQIEELKMHEPSKPIVELLKLILQGKDSLPNSSIYTQIKKLQNIV